MTQQLEHPAGATPPASSRFTFRRIDLEHDVPRIVRLFNEIEAVDQIDDGITEEELRERLGWPEGDPALDRWLVVDPHDPDRLIGHGGAWKSSTSVSAGVGARVHPAWRGQGVGSELLARAIARAQEKGARYVTSDVDDALPASHTFLQRRGFRPDSTWVLMAAPAGLALAAPVLPPGYTIRAYSGEADLPALRTALNRGFIGHHEHHDITEAELAHWLAAPTTRPAGILLAFGPAGDVAGICWSEISPARTARRGAPTGYIDSLAVVPEHRRHGLGRALLLAGMAWLRAEGQGAIELDAWGENARALPLYLGVGFAVTRRGTDYRRDLEITG